MSEALQDPDNNASPKSLFIKLHNTLLLNDLSEVMKLINEGHNFNAMYEGKPLYFIIFDRLRSINPGGSWQSLVPLTTVGFDFELRSEAGLTLLDYLAFHCEYECIVLLFKKSLDGKFCNNSPIKLLLTKLHLSEEKFDRAIRTIFAYIYIGDYSLWHYDGSMLCDNLEEVSFVYNGVNGPEFVRFLMWVVTIDLYVHYDAMFLYLIRIALTNIIAMFDYVPRDTEHRHRNTADEIDSNTNFIDSENTSDNNVQAVYSRFYKHPIADYDPITTDNKTINPEMLMKILNKDFANMTTSDKARDIMILCKMDIGKLSSMNEIISKVDSAFDDTLISTVIRSNYFPNHHYEHSNVMSFLENRSSVKCWNYEDVLYDLTGIAKYSPPIVNECSVTIEDDRADIFDNLLHPMHRSLVYLLLLCGKLEMMFEVLKTIQFDMIPMCLVVIIILKSITKKFVFPKRSLDIIQRAEEQYEEVCRRVITSMCTHRHYSHSQKCHFMTMPFAAYGNNSIYELAIKAECRSIVDFELFEAIREKYWLGGLHRSPMPERVFKIMCPYAVPMLRYVEGWRIGHGWNGFQEILDSPLTKFVYHFAAHIIFLFMFTYVLMTTFNQSLSVIDVLCVIYMLGYMVDEIVEFSSYRAKSTSAYLMDEWNIVDVGGILFYIVGLGIRIACHIVGDKGSPQHDSVLYAARVVSVISLLLLWLRTLYYLQVLTYIGPKVSMIARMAKNDLLPLLSLFFVALLSFGVAAQVLLYPNTPENEQNLASFLTTILKLLVKSFYTMITVDLMLGDFDNGVCDSNTTCPDMRGIGLVKNGVLIIYIIVANILLLNLLIAVFSNTISEVEAQSRQYWVSRRQYITQQISKKVLPPPLNMLCYLCHVCHFRMPLTVHHELNSDVDSQEDVKVIDYFMDIHQSIIDIEAHLPPLGEFPDRKKYIKSLKTSGQISFLFCQASVLRNIRADL